MNKAEAAVDAYLKRASELRIVPNFWLTREYCLSIQDNISLETNGKVIWLQEGDWALFPPLPVKGQIYEGIENDCPSLKIWSDFENYSPGEKEKAEFLDWEYTYDSSDFLDLSGSRWRVFRKNVRKWPRANKDNLWNYTPLSPKREEIERLLIKWLEHREEKTIHDDKSLEWFIFNGSRREFLYLRRKDASRDLLVGINVWDEYKSFPYRVIYRYCIVDPEERFLDEFCRLLFYRSLPGRYVIDGGTLGNPGLERFKDRLNPVSKRPVYSRRIG